MHASPKPVGLKTDLKVFTSLPEQLGLIDKASQDCRTLQLLVAMTTIKNISQYLGLSMTQVSRALNGHSDVNEKTKKRVQDAAAELG